MQDRLQRAGIRPTSPRLFRAFGSIARLHLRRSFRAVRLAHAERLPPPQSSPLVLYLNHASWWDPLVCMLLALRLLPRRRHYAPIDAEALKQYNFFRRLGMFPIQMESRQGAAQFLRGAEAVLREGHVLWMTPEGRFTDARSRPVELRPGLAALLLREPSTTAVPVAVEYTFWDQQRPEVLINIGEPVRLGAEKGTAEVTALLASALTAAKDELAALALTRDPRAFATLEEGRRGTRGVYGLWQRLRAVLGGRRFQPDHTGHLAELPHPVAGAAEAQPDRTA